jgi:hypothetical protein
VPRLYRSAWFVAACSLLVFTGCATGPGGPALVDVSGRWLGTWEFESSSTPGGGSVTADLKQVGSVVTGSLEVTGPTSGRPITANGIVYGRDYHLKGATLSGILSIDGDRMTGIVHGLFPVRVSLTRRK